MKSIQLITISTALAVFTAATAHPAKIACSIHPAKGASDLALTKLAKVSKATAQANALRSLGNSKVASVAAAELEAEDGCLIWSFDVKQKNIPGIQEVNVDAGTGKVLSSVHETSRDQAMEAAQDAAAVKK